MTKPRVFIGCSARGLAVAEHLQAKLNHLADFEIGSQKAFGLCGNGLDSVCRRVSEFDFAFLVIDAQDLEHERATLGNSARENVLFLFGLFIGALGRDRTYGVIRRDHRSRLPADLADVLFADYAVNRSHKLDQALESVCFRLKTALDVLGRRAPERSPESVTTPSDDLSTQEKPAPTKARPMRELAFLEGVWRGDQNGSKYCVRIRHGKVRCVYTYNGKDVTGEFYAIRVVENRLVARFKWFSRHFSGVARLQIVSPERLEGGWWHDSHATYAELVNGHEPSGMAPSVWIKQSDAAMPDWAEQYFQKFGER